MQRQLSPIQASEQSKLADALAEIDKLRGQIDIIKRELEGDGPEWLANDYGGLGWEQEEPVATIRKMIAQRHALTGDKLKEIAMRHSTLVAGYEYGERFDWDAIVQDPEFPR